MHMFDQDCKLHKYTNVHEILQAFYNVRLEIYEKRKQYLLTDMRNKLVKLSNRAKYIQETLAGTIDLRRMKSNAVNELLTNKQYAKIDDDYKYLIKMPMDSVTEENVAQIMKEKETTEKEIDVLSKTRVQTLWSRELTKLETEYDKYKLQREKIQASVIKIKKVEKKVKKVARKK